MRLSTAHIERAKDLIVPGGGRDEFIQILADVIEHRRTHRLDEKFPYVRNSVISADVLKYELEKLMVIFEMTRQDPTVGDRLEWIAEFKTRFPPAEVDEIIEEYFPELLTAKAQ